jgi:hypothetical protein
VAFPAFRFSSASMEPYSWFDHPMSQASMVELNPYVTCVTRHPSGQCPKKRGHPAHLSIRAEVGVVECRGHLQRTRDIVRGTNG